jgi:hypothetical protein
MSEKSAYRTEPNRVLPYRILNRTEKTDTETSILETAFYVTGSVMQYNGLSFSSDGSVTMIPTKGPLYAQTMGSGAAKGPTFLDVLQLNLHYNCTGK